LWEEAPQAAADADAVQCGNKKKQSVVKQKGSGDSRAPERAPACLTDHLEHKPLLITSRGKRNGYVCNGGSVTTNSACTHVLFHTTLLACCSHATIARKEASVQIDGHAEPDNPSSITNPSGIMSGATICRAAVLFLSAAAAAAVVVEASLAPAVASGIDRALAGRKP